MCAWRAHRLHNQHAINMQSHTINTLNTHSTHTQHYSHNPHAHGSSRARADPQAVVILRLATMSELQAAVGSQWKRTESSSSESESDDEFEQVPLPSFPFECESQHPFETNCRLALFWNLPVWLNHTRQNRCEHPPRRSDRPPRRPTPL
jgi:hypothetical protein